MSDWLVVKPEGDVTVEVVEGGAVVVAEGVTEEGVLSADAPVHLPLI